MTDRAMTVREVAEYLNVDLKVIYRMLNNRALPGFKVAGTWRFKRADLDAWIEEQKRHAAPTVRRQTTVLAEAPPDNVDTKALDHTQLEEEAH